MIPRELWLAKAKGLGVNTTTRVYHLNEKRPNLVIGNSPEKWWCYCQACKQGGVEEKEHVRLGYSPEAKRSDLTLPPNMHSIDALLPGLQAAVLAFISSKGMDLCMLPPVYYSDTRKRILLNTEQGWLGRDITGLAKEKWLTYSGAHWLGRYVPDAPAVIVEDAFSFFKLAWAVPEWSTYCALGTRLHPGLLTGLLGTPWVSVMFDGDDAGFDGADVAVLRLRGLGLKARERCAPDGKDPKDLQAAEIRTWLGLD